MRVYCAGQQLKVSFYYKLWGTRLHLATFAGLVAFLWCGCGGRNLKQTIPLETGCPDSQLVDLILQKAINFGGLKESYFPEIAGRGTLSIHGKCVSPVTQLVWYGNPVTVVADTCSRSGNCIEVKVLQVQRDTVRVSLWYPIEGVWCDLTYEVSDRDHLILVSHRVMEI